MRVLVIEDDVKAAHLLARGLREEGFVVEVAHSAEDGQRRVHDIDYGLLVLDCLLPGQNGVGMCRDLRNANVHTPILMLTARDGLHDRINGLNAGADDYLTKPYAFEELLARARALLRRSEITRRPLLCCGDLQLDPTSQQVSCAGRRIDLTRKEFGILHILLRQQGSVVSRSALAEQLWHDDQDTSDNVIDVHVSNLRRKISVAGPSFALRTIRGRGYLLSSDPLC